MTASALITLIISIVGGTIGTAGFILSVLNHLRDRPVVKVTLQWDMSVTPSPVESRYDHRKPWGLIRVTNVGRRPIYISLAALEYCGTFYDHVLYRLFKRQPRHYFCSIINDSIGGKKLSEGDRPEAFVVSQDGMERHSNYWFRVRAFVEDSAGKKYISAPVDCRPSWAGGLPWAGR